MQTKQKKNPYRKKMLCWLAAIILVIVLIVVIIVLRNYFNNLKYRPVLNQNPKYFMTIHGNISPVLIGKVRLTWVAVYASSNPQCDVTNNTFEGIVGWRTAEVPYIAKPSASGDYSFKIPLDYYQPGYCKWKIMAIEDHTGNIPASEYGDVAQFYPCGESAACIGGLGNVAPSPLIYSLKAGTYNICRYDSHKTLACEMLSSSTDFSSNGDIPRDHNYDFIETYQLSK